MTPRVPRDGGNTVAELDAVAVEPLGDLQRALVDFGIIGAMDGTFDRPRDNFLLAVDCCRVLENSVTQQRPVLHQTKHMESQRAVARRGSFARIDAKSSATRGCRKWASGWGSARQAAMVTAAALLLLAAARHASLPPRPSPSERCPCRGHARRKLRQPSRSRLPRRTAKTLSRRPLRRRRLPPAVSP